MIYNLGEFGTEIAKNDKIIEESIHNMIEKENTIINEYNSLKNSYNDSNDELKSDFEKQLEEKKLILAYKLESKEKQCEALYKILEYINELDELDKKIQSQKILNKINILEKEILPYKELFI